MHATFAALANDLDPKFQELVAMSPVRYNKLPKVLPTRAIYLFSENGKHLYVGRTNGLRRRLRGHCIPSATHFTATFAFRIAREATRMHRASYTKVGSRAALVEHDLFGPQFIAAKRRIPLMELRYVEETDPVRQALLEIYTAVVLKTPYNDFDNH
jgi:hypothetical protein